MMPGYGYGHMGWAGWLGMSIAVTVWTAVVVLLGVWAARFFPPSMSLSRGGLDARLAGLEAEVAKLREQVRLNDRDSTANRP